MIAKKISKACLVITSMVMLSGVQAEDLPHGWQFDSIAPKQAKGDAQLVNDVILAQTQAWNAHDIDGFMGYYWNSPDLLVVVDSEQFNGWSQLYQSYINGFPDRNAMGFLETPRVQIKLLKPDMAFVLLWWNVYLGAARHKVVGTSTLIVQKFAEGWKIIASHTASAEP
ncbi:MAG: hypothetical protein WB586_27475 [Chthoniobacterales bacterium]